MQPRMSLSHSILIALLVSSVGLSQDPFSGAGNDPFATPAGTDAGFGAFGAANQPATSTASAAAPEAVDLNDPDPLVRILRATPPSSPSEMADGLNWMARIKRWDEAGRLLDLVASKNWSLDQKATLSRTAGSALWIRLRGQQAELTAEQKSLVSEILRAPSTLAKSPQWIDGWIEKLGSESAGERRLAQYRLQDGSHSAIEKLVQRLLNGDANIPSSILAATIQSFGRDGIDALRAACMVDNPAGVFRVLSGIAALKERNFSAELGAALYGRVLTDKQRKELAEALAGKHNGLPSEKDVLTFLNRKFADAMAAYQTARANKSGISDWVWQLSSDRQAVSAVESASPTRELERLAQVAALQLQQTSLPTDSAPLAIASVLQRAYQMSPEQGQSEAAASLLVDISKLAPNQEANWERVYAVANELNFHGAALRTLQMIGESESPSLDFLSDQLKDTRPVIRYSALAAVANIDPQSIYRGADRAVSTALEMSRLAGGPNSLIIGLQSEIRQVANQQVQAITGGQATTVNSARNALLALASGEPIELIFVVDRVSDQSVFELLQRVRNTVKGRSIPIAVLTEELYSHERAWIAGNGGVVSSVLSRDPSQMQRVIAEMMNELDTEPLNPDDREKFSRTGGRFLAKIAAEPERYRFYPLGNWREQMVSTALNLDAGSEIRLLAGLASVESQLRLVEMAGNRQFGYEIQKSAATGFGQSVQRYGLLLNRTAVKRSYDTYNRLGEDNPSIANSLGYVLDVIEANAGKAEWPASL